MKPFTSITILNHDDETTETLTLEEFVKRFNNEQMSDAVFSVLSITYPILNDKAIASQTFTDSDTIQTRDGEKTFDPETATWR